MRATAENCDRPIVMPMSNPTPKAECTPEEAYRWTDGRAIVATGSPFTPVEIDSKTFIPSQCNNMYVFPGIGLAASVAGVSTITDRMLYRAAVACSDSMNEEEIAAGRTFPALHRIREVSLNVACAVIEEGFEQGICEKLSDTTFENPDQLKEFVARKMYYPKYAPLI